MAGVPSSRSGGRTRRRIRLDPRTYAEPGVASITVAVRERRMIFAAPAVAEAAVGVLRELAGRRGVPVYAYCVMPDHAHLVLAPAVGCDILAFAGQFKNLTQRAAWRLGVSGAFWQRSFWDRLLRADEPLEAAVEYVLNNPVRAGLVSAWREYPYCGSLTWEL